MKIKTELYDQWLEHKKVNSEEAYSKATVDFAEKWGDIMEHKIEDGCPLAACARPSASEADTDGVTGFMYSCAVRILAHFWVHGEELRRWHNLDTQIKNEGEIANERGGVLNPALLTVDIGR